MTRVTQVTQVTQVTDTTGLRHVCNLNDGYMTDHLWRELRVIGKLVMGRPVARDGGQLTEEELGRLGFYGIYVSD